MNDLAKKRTAPRCANCGQYSTHENLTAVNTDDGVARICPACLDDKVGDGTAKSWKQLHKSQWDEAARSIDEALAEVHRKYPESTDQLAKSQAFDRLAKVDVWGRFDRWLANYDREQAQTKRIVSLVKAEKAKSDAINMAKQTKKMNRKTVKLNRKAEATKARVAETERLIAESVQSHLDMTARVEAFTLDARTRIDGMMKRLEVGQAQVRRSREYQATAELARQDQIRADWSFKAGQTSDPDMRRYYLAMAAGEDPDADD